MEEDYDHLIRCPQRQPWRDSFCSTLNDYLKKQDTAPELRRLIREGLREWMNSVPDNLIQYDQSTNTKISWHHAVRGYFNKGIARAQERHYRVLEQRHRQMVPHAVRPKFRRKDGYTGQRWMAKLIRFIWQEIQSLWKARNVEVHGEGLQSEKEREALELTVDTLYNTSSSLCQHDKILFERPRDYIKQLRTSDLKIWVRDTSQVVKMGLKDARIQDKQGVQDIRNFFTRIRRPAALTPMTMAPNTDTDPIPQELQPD
jgi:hypothetical protein